MPEDMDRNTEARRRLLKALATGGGAVAGATLLPQRWTRPLLKSVILPAHAQASALLVCSTGPHTEDNSTSNGHVAIIYDGSTGCSLVHTDDGAGGSSGDPNEMLLLDVDGNPVTDFDLQGPTYGANWGPGPDVDNQGQGNYTFNRLRAAAPNAGVTFSLSFNVSFSGSNLTISNVQIFRL